MPQCPECRDGKHQNCTGWAYHPVTDEEVNCACPNPFHIHIDKKEEK